MIHGAKSPNTQPEPPKDLNELCARSRSEGRYYYGDYPHQVRLLNARFDEHEAVLATQMGLSPTSAQLARFQTAGMRQDAIAALQRRMAKFFNLREKQG